MKHRYKNKNGYTMPHSIFLPMVIGTSEDISAVMHGLLIFNPVVNENDLSKLIDAVPPE